MYTAVRDGGLRSAFQKRRSWSAAERGWLITRMPPGADNLALVFRKLRADLASTMEPAHVLHSRCEFDFVFEDTTVFVACIVARRVLELRGKRAACFA